MMDINKLLIERCVVHGNVSDNAKVAQAFRMALSHGVAWSEASDVQREALHNILGKMASIVSGDPSEPDHWVAIIGYATMAYKDTMNESV